jgi:hypothetical protein
MWREDCLSKRQPLMANLFNMWLQLFRDFDPERALERLIKDCQALYPRPIIMEN